MEYQPKLINKKYSPFLHCVSSFEGISYAGLKDPATSSFISYCFTLALTSANLIFHNFLELHSALSEKKILSQIFLFYRIPGPISGRKTIQGLDASLLKIALFQKDHFLLI